MPKFLPPERLKIDDGKLSLNLLIAKLWLISLVAILMVFILGLLPTNQGLILSFSISLGLALGIARGLNIWRKNQVTKKLEKYEQDYLMYLRQRRK